MNTSALKIISLLSALFVFLPDRIVTLPFGLILEGVFYLGSSWPFTALVVFVWASAGYITYSTIRDLKSRIDSVLIIIPLALFLVFLGTKWSAFIHYPHWLPISTGLFSVVVISKTIVVLSREFSFIKKQISK